MTERREWAPEGEQKSENGRETMGRFLRVRETQQTVRRYRDCAPVPARLESVRKGEIRWHRREIPSVLMMKIRAGGFLYNRKLCFPLYKNAPRGSHCGGKGKATFAARRRRIILQSRIFS